jgi:O-antigen/teichoic acid export membrane protein
MPLALITALSVVMLPRISNEFKKKNTESVKTYIAKSLNFSLMMSIPLMFGLAAVSSTMISWFLGNGYENVTNIMFTLSPIVLFISISSVSGSQYLTAINKTKVLTFSCIAGAIVNVILNAIFIPMYNSVGAAIGTIGAELTVTLIQLYHIRDVIKINEIIKMGMKYIISGILMFMVCIIIGNHFGSTIISTLLQICTGGILYFISLLILKDKFFIECIYKVVNMLKK